MRVIHERLILIAVTCFALVMIGGSLRTPNTVAVSNHPIITGCPAEDSCVPVYVNGIWTIQEVHP